MPWEEYVALIKEQARSLERRELSKQHRMRQLSFGISIPQVEPHWGNHLGSLLLDSA
jgi:hypothetical protein